MNYEFDAETFFFSVIGLFLFDSHCISFKLCEGSMRRIFLLYLKPKCYSYILKEQIIEILSASSSPSNEHTELIAMLKIDKQEGGGNTTS